MKTIFKSVLTLGLVTGLGFVANAQNSVSQVVSASATIQDVLTITKDNDVAFGNIPATTAGAVFLDPKGTSDAYVGSTATIGKVKILGSGGASVKVDWQGTVDLEGQTVNTEKIVYGVLINGNTTDNQGSSSELGTGGQGVANTADVTLEATSGEYFLFIGGGFPALTGGLSSQTYSGDITFTFEYN